MIDVAVNEFSGLSVVHDESELQGALAFEVDAPSGEASIVLRDGRRRALPTLSPSIVAMLRPDCPAEMVRMEGLRVAAAHPVILRIAD